MFSWNWLESIGDDARERLIQLARKGQLTIRLIRSVREARGDGGGDAKLTGRRGTKPKAATRATAVRVLEKLADQLNGIREAGRLLDTGERAFLEGLRAEIDLLLASPSNFDAEQLMAAGLLCLLCTLGIWCRQVPDNRDRDGCAVSTRCAQRVRFRSAGRIRFVAPSAGVVLPIQFASRGSLVATRV
jgi:hypothetical protein